MGDSKYDNIFPTDGEEEDAERDAVNLLADGQNGNWELQVWDTHKRISK